MPTSSPTRLSVYTIPRWLSQCPQTENYHGGQITVRRREYFARNEGSWLNPSTIPSLSHTFLGCVGASRGCGKPYNWRWTRKRRANHQDQRDIHAKYKWWICLDSIGYYNLWEEITSRNEDSPARRKCHCHSGTQWRWKIHPIEYSHRFFEYQLHSSCGQYVLMLEISWAHPGLNSSHDVLTTSSAPLCCSSSSWTYRFCSPRWPSSWILHCQILHEALC